MRQLLLRALVLGFALLGASTVRAQEPGEQVTGGRGQFAGMQRVTGEVTAVTGDSISVKGEDGSAYKVTTTANTRLMKDRGTPFKTADLKPGDGVIAVGNMDAPNKTLHAAMVFATDAEQVKKLKENFGKTYITGKVTSIDADNLKMTVLRTDGVSQTIGFDETTSFKRGGRGMRAGGGNAVMVMGGGVTAAGGAAPAGGESITLADIKVGDTVAGQGSMKSGLFVPAQLNVMAPRPPRKSAEGGASPDAAVPKPQ